MSASPGPWVESNGEIYSGDHCVARKHWNVHDDDPQWRADAALIVVAPDMLALIRRLSTWAPRGLEGQIEDDVAGIRQEACALLARVLL